MHIHRCGGPYPTNSSEWGTTTVWDRLFHCIRAKCKRILLTCLPQCLESVQPGVGDVSMIYLSSVSSSGWTVKVLLCDIHSIPTCSPFLPQSSVVAPACKKLCLVVAIATLLLGQALNLASCFSHGCSFLGSDYRRARYHHVFLVLPSILLSPWQNVITLCPELDLLLARGCKKGLVRVLCVWIWTNLARFQSLSTVSFLCKGD